MREERLQVGDVVRVRRGSYAGVIGFVTARRWVGEAHVLYQVSTLDGDRHTFLRADLEGVEIVAGGQQRKAGGDA